MHKHTSNTRSFSRSPARCCSSTLHSIIIIIIIITITLA